MRDPDERAALGRKTEEEMTGAAPQTPATLYQSAWRDFVFSEVWTRPGLDLRARFLISIAVASCAQDAARAALYAKGALAGGHARLTELREAALHLGVYGGFTEGGVFDAAVTVAAAGLGLSDEAFPPLRDKPWDPAARLDAGASSFKTVMTFGGPPPRTAYFEGGILNFVFADMWSRPGLDQRARRWLTLVGVGYSSAKTPIRSHVWSALASGDATADEMLEFVLQFAVHSGWPRASYMQSVVLEMIEKVKKGLPFDA
ncbi:MAG: carboxymuconolactone decarboxylase family protein [Parvularculaceae bacterium]|nr:carboxymuconolactone decarboxylase family protein [Parvularculaceae bacterium]